ncbi:MAG: Epoxyqueuosine reductase [Methanomassiliicoccales archaeon PtaU1.Bin124]|nr:MAG: Epoxyqueuosine reductase [Methanomassiliicoccales archaeon PtaU1.Bin124]
MRQSVIALALSMGIDKVGFASLKGIEFRGDLERRGIGLDQAISLVMRLPAPAISRNGADGYHEAMVRGREEMDLAANAIAKLLRSYGHHALPVTSDFKAVPEIIAGQISHRMVAYRAGLGWIGRSTLLVTPEFGPRVRLITILTDADLGSGMPLANACGDCHRCIDNCPMNALKLTRFTGYPDRAAIIDYQKCDRYEQATLERQPPSFCAMCVRSCPVGK